MTNTMTFKNAAVEFLLMIHHIASRKQGRLYRIVCAYLRLWIALLGYAPQSIVDIERETLRRRLNKNG